MNARKQKDPKASKEKAARETCARKVTFKAVRKEEESISKSKPALGVSAAGGSSSKLQMGKETTRPAESKAAISLRGLLAAQRISKEFKSRTAARSQSRLQVSPHKPITIINEQIPDSAANPKEKFSCAKAEELIREYLPTKLAHVTYEPEQGTSLSTTLSEEIKRLVKTVTPPRYKLIVNVAIGNKDETADIVVTSQCLWDPHSDNFTSSQYMNPTLFCVVLVHAVYFE